MIKIIFIFYVRVHVVGNRPIFTLQLLNTNTFTVPTDVLNVLQIREMIIHKL